MVEFNNQVALEPVSQLWGRALLKINLDREIDICLACVCLLVNLKVIDPHFGLRLNSLASVVGVAQCENRRFLLRLQRIEVKPVLSRAVGLRRQVNTLKLL